MVADGEVSYWNFRKAVGISPVYGMGQSCLGGLTRCLKYIAEQPGYDKIVCCNMREEPVVFVGGMPIAPREEGHLNDNVGHLGGINGYELTLMERKLKAEVLARGPAS